MATSDSVPSVLPEGFRYETKYIVLTYMGTQPVGTSRSAAEEGDENERERSRMVKEQLEEELRQLEDEMAANFDRRSSLVFTPAVPESSIEDRLAVMGRRVAAELDVFLTAAVQTLLAGPLDYQRFRETSLSLSTHTDGGWNKVLVPLVLLQALQSKGQSVTTLLDIGVRLLEEEETDFIVQEGGWGEIFNLASDDDRAATVADDNNDIYILSAEQHPDHPSPPSSLLCAGDNGSEQSSWQTESLPVSLAGHESWAQVAAMDPEDVKSLDSNDGAALAEERSENNSSNSDIVHVEREEAELLEEGGDVGGGGIEESMMSVLGTESELAELREHFKEQAEAAPASLISLEDSVVVETSASVSAEPSLVPSEPELLSTASLDAAEPEPLTSKPEPEPEAAAAPAPAEPAPAPPASETPAVPTDAAVKEAEEEPQTAEEPAAAHVAAPPPSEAPEAEKLPEAPAEFPALLYGGAALVVLAAVVTYSVLRYRKK